MVCIINTVRSIYFCDYSAIATKSYYQINYSLVFYYLCYCSMHCAHWSTPEMQIDTQFEPYQIEYVFVIRVSPQNIKILQPAQKL